MWTGYWRLSRPACARPATLPDRRLIVDGVAWGIPTPGQGTHAPCSCANGCTSRTCALPAANTSMPVRVCAPTSDQGGVRTRGAPCFKVPNAVNHPAHRRWLLRLLCRLVVRLRHDRRPGPGRRWGLGQGGGGGTVLAQLACCSSVHTLVHCWCVVVPVLVAGAEPRKGRHTRRSRSAQLGHWALASSYISSRACPIM